MIVHAFAAWQTQETRKVEVGKAVKYVTKTLKVAKESLPAKLREKLKEVCNFGEEGQLPADEAASAAEVQAAAKKGRFKKAPSSAGTSAASTL